MIETGKLTVRLKCAAANVQAVEILSTRPLHICRLFVGKTPEQTLKTLPLLFNVCGIAQAFAAFSALSQALGLNENPRSTEARQILLQVEIIREHCWWLLINRDKKRLAPFLQYPNAFKKALFVNGDAFSLTSRVQSDFTQLGLLITQLEQQLDELFAGQRLDWLRLKTSTELYAWLRNNPSTVATVLNEIIANQFQALGCAAVKFLPELSDTELTEYLRLSTDEDFSRTPHWQGKRYETSCLTRQQYQPLIADLLQHYGNGLLTRVVSRLYELANFPNRLKQNAGDLMTASPSKDWQSCLPQHIGLAQIQTSRGLLIHYVELAQDKISRYQIIAPTEWNFHPKGIAANSLKRLSAANHVELRQQAESVIKAIDPCVSFELQLKEE